MSKDDEELQVLFKNLREASYQKIPKGLDDRILFDARKEIQKGISEKRSIIDWKIFFSNLYFQFNQLGGYFGLGFATSCLTVGILIGSIGNEFLYNSDLFGPFFIYLNGDPTEALLNDIDIFNISLFAENQDD